MTKARWLELNRDIDPPDNLTEAEIAEGWHFCTEMDGLLANSKDPEGDCFCELNTSRKKS